MKNMGKNKSADLKTKSEQFHHPESESSDIGWKYKKGISLLFIFSSIRGCDSMKPRGEYIFPATGNCSLSRLVRYRHLILNKNQSAYIPVPQLRERKRISARRRNAETFLGAQFVFRELSRTSRD